jgi:hypothetical protein
MQHRLRTGSEDLHQQSCVCAMDLQAVDAKQRAPADGDICSPQGPQRALRWEGLLHRLGIPGLASGGATGDACLHASRCIAPTTLPPPCPVHTFTRPPIAPASTSRPCLPFLSPPHPRRKARLTATSSVAPSCVDSLLCIPAPPGSRSGARVAPASNLPWLRPSFDTACSGLPTRPCDTHLLQSAPLSA